MKLSPDSPELTAYALGELDPVERAAIETALSEAPELRAELAALRFTAEALTTEFSAEPAMELSPDQRAAIVRSAGVPSAVEAARFDEKARGLEGRHTTLWERILTWRTQLSWLTAAACVAVLVFAVGRRSKSERDSFQALRYQPGRLALADSKPVLKEEIQELAKLPAPTGTGATDLGLKSVTTRTDLRSDQLTELQSAATKVNSAQTVASSSPRDSSKDYFAKPTAASALATKADRLVDTKPRGGAAPTPAASVPVQRYAMDPVLAQRYGLVPQQPPASDFNLNAGASSSEASKLGRRSLVAAQDRGLSDKPSPSIALEGLVREKTLTLVRQTPASTTALDLARVDDLSALGERRGEAKFGEQMRRIWAYQPPAGAAVGLGFRSAGDEAYAPVTDNPFKEVTAAPLSTFGMDVDTASYANIRRFLRDGSLPPPDAVRLEELVNYFHYDYPQPRGDAPFGATVEVAACPWSETHKLVRVGVKAKDLARGERPRANLVFLLDVSGSMEPENRLPLVKRSLRLLLDKLTPRDTVGIVTYAGEARVALEPVALTADGKQRTTAVLESLRAGSGTHGSAGIQNAYAMATNHFVKEGVNRVILCTDGDFNIGITDRGELLNLITQEAKSGVFLSVLGFGMGNLKDATMETLADQGNGNYAYLDSFSEARKVLVEQLDGTLVTVAKDAKVQVEFNPARVASYRLLGYEKRLLRDRDFNDDTKDAGEVGAGHSVTVLYEIVPVGPNLAGVDPLRYAEKNADAAGAVAKLKPIHTDELLNLKLRYKQPDGDKSRLIEQAVKDGDREFAQAGSDFKFAAAVAGYGMLLRDSPHKGDLTWEKVLRLAEQGLGDDKEGYRAEFVDLARTAQKLSGGK
jgi:Ca-activated chloride channel family protein